MLLPEGLYAPSLKERWTNTRELLKNKQGRSLVDFGDSTYDEAEQYWREHLPFCFGAANAWLLVVGPSPGHAEPAKSKSAKEYEKLKFKLWIGAPHPGFGFEDANDYFPHLSKLFIDNFFRAYDPQIDTGVGRALTHHSNLLPTKSGKQPDLNKLSSEERALAIKRVTHIFRETQPRCIIANTKPVFKFLRQYLKYEQKVDRLGEIDFTTSWGQPLTYPYELWRSENNYKILFASIPFPGRSNPAYRYLPEFAARLAKIAREELNAEADIVS